MICSTCDAPVAVDSLKIWNSRTVCTDCFGVISGQAAPSQPNPENLRTIRETTVCPACQAEFHKDHPVCPECNVVLDPAFRVARQTKRAVQEVSELVVENIRTTRQFFVYVLRVLIAGVLWAGVVIGFVLSIYGLVTQQLSFQWWSVPCFLFWCFKIWLARRISPGHFRSRPRLNNESASKPLVNSSVVIETDSTPDSPSRFELEPQTANEKPEVLAPASEPDVARFEPAGDDTLFIYSLLCLSVAFIGFVFLLNWFSQPSPHVRTSSEGTTNQGTASQNESEFLEPKSKYQFDGWDESSTKLDEALAKGQATRDFYLKRMADQEARLKAMEVQEETEEKARFQRLGAFEKVRETAANILIPGSRK